MNKRHNSFRHFIGEEEDELLEHLWKQIPAPKESPSVTDQGLIDLWQRIRLQRRKKRAWLMSLGIGTAAAVFVGVLWLRVPAFENHPAACNQLADQIADVADDQILLTVDGNEIIPLDQSAMMQDNANGSTSLSTAVGQQRMLTGAQMLKVEVPDGKRLQLTLSDGTHIYLNAGTTLEYPASFKGKKDRKVRLCGEAYFEVAHNKECPFRVELNTGENIQVLGTSFNIHAYAEDAAHATTLLSGSISYQAGRKSHPVTLCPGQQACYDVAQKTVKMLRVNVQDVVAWKAGLICFDNEPLPQLARKLARIYGIRIQVDERLQHVSFSGKISYDKGVDYITHLLTETTGIECTINNGIIYLK